MIVDEAFDPEVDTHRKIPGIDAGIYVEFLSKAMEITLKLILYYYHRITEIIGLSEYF